MDEQHPATPVYDRPVEDVGNIVEFGHVNVPRAGPASWRRCSTSSGLGLTRDPYLMTSTDNMWINVGTAQFHLPTGAAQVLRGVTGLVLPDLDALLRRLRRVAPRLAGTQVRPSHERDDAVEVTCPWGNRIRCHAPDPKRFGRSRSACRMSRSTPPPAAPPASRASIARSWARRRDRTVATRPARSPGRRSACTRA